MISHVWYLKGIRALSVVNSCCLMIKIRFGHVTTGGSKFVPGKGAKIETFVKEKKFFFLKDHLNIR